MTGVSKFPFLQKSPNGDDVGGHQAPSESEASLSFRDAALPARRTPASRNQASMGKETSLSSPAVFEIKFVAINLKP